MGSDLSVVNAARVSYGKHTDTMRNKDIGLLKYLAAHGHWTPFAHPQISFRISANISVARQLFRHQVGLAVNEVSRRYVTDEPVFDLPDVWRTGPGKGQSKQGSGGPVKSISQEMITKVAMNAINNANMTYQRLLGFGVAPEQARLVLPMALVTEWIWSGSLYAFIRVCTDRLAGDAQAETRAVAVLIDEHLQTLFPHSVTAWGL